MKKGKIDQQAIPGLNLWQMIIHHVRPAECAKSSTAVLTWVAPWCCKRAESCSARMKAKGSLEERTSWPQKLIDLE